MARFIFGEQQNSHHRYPGDAERFALAQRFIEQVVASGKDVCFVGTKRQAKDSIAKYAEVGMPFVNERWLGGILTNFRTIRDRLGRLEELDLGGIWRNRHLLQEDGQPIDAERRKITRNLDGIRNTEKMPGVLMVVDVNRETNALREAKSLGIPTIGLVDTDGDPDLVDIAIPGNDDSIHAVEAILRELCASISRGGVNAPPKPRVMTPRRSPPPATMMPPPPDDVAPAGPASVPTTVALLRPSPSHRRLNDPHSFPEHPRIHTKESNCEFHRR